MNEAISQMLKKYHCVSYLDYKNALKEIIQEIALLGLWRSKFFEKAAFYGGTALRILYHLNRFSEDLDFSLLAPSSTFDLSQYERALIKELGDFDFQVSFNRKEKKQDSTIQSAFIKANTLKHLLLIDIPQKERKRCHLQEQLKIKVEIDTDPPSDFLTENHHLLQPIPFSIKTYSKPDLFAGKIHALLYRGWKRRCKGRDWYDFIWFIAHHVPIHLKHLQKRIEQTDGKRKTHTITANQIKEMITEKVLSLDINLAKKDILPFIKEPSTIAIWSKDFFLSLIEKLTFC